MLGEVGIVFNNKCSKRFSKDILWKSYEGTSNMIILINIINNSNTLINESIKNLNMFHCTNSEEP